MSQQKGLSPIIIVVLIAAVSVGGYFLYTKYSINQTKNLSQTVKPFPASMGETYNWKTYSNQKYGYTLKYPSNYFIEETKDPNGNIGTTTISNYTNEDFSSGRKNADDTDVFLMFITIPEKDTNLDEAKSFYIPANKIEDYVIDGVTGFRVGKDGAIVIIYKKKEYNFNLRNVNSKHRNDYNQILATFKFLDQTAQPSSTSSAERILAYKEVEEFIVDCKIYSFGRSHADIKNGSLSIGLKDGNGKVNWIQVSENYYSQINKKIEEVTSSGKCPEVIYWIE